MWTSSQDTQKAASSVTGWTRSSFQQKEIKQFDRLNSALGGKRHSMSPLSARVLHH